MLVTPMPGSGVAGYGLSLPARDVWTRGENAVWPDTDTDTDTDTNFWGPEKLKLGKYKRN